MGFEYRNFFKVVVAIYKHRILFSLIKANVALQNFWYTSLEACDPVNVPYDKLVHIGAILIFQRFYITYYSFAILHSPGNAVRYNKHYLYSSCKIILVR